MQTKEEDEDITKTKHQYYLALVLFCSGILVVLIAILLFYNSILDQYNILIPFAFATVLIISAVIVIKRPKGNSSYGRM